MDTDKPHVADIKLRRVKWKRLIPCSWSCTVYAYAILLKLLSMQLNEH